MQYEPPAIFCLEEDIGRGRGYAGDSGCAQVEDALGAGDPGGTVFDPDAGVGELKPYVLRALEDLFPAVPDNLPASEHGAAGVDTGHPLGIVPDLLHAVETERLE